MSIQRFKQWASLDYDYHFKSWASKDKMTTKVRKPTMRLRSMIQWTKWTFVHPREMWRMKFKVCSFDIWLKQITSSKSASGKRTKSKPQLKNRIQCDCYAAWLIHALDCLWFLSWVCSIDFVCHIMIMDSNPGFKIKKKIHLWRLTEKDKSPVNKFKLPEGTGASNAGKQI